MIKNPITGKVIDKNGPTHKKLMKEGKLDEDGNIIKVPFEKFPKDVQKVILDGFQFLLDSQKDADVCMAAMLHNPLLNYNYIPEDRLTPEIMDVYYLYELL